MGLIKFFLAPSLISVALPPSFVFLNSNSQEEIILATYQSYISEDIAKEAFDTYSLKTIYFETDKEVFNGFASGAFDLAILSSSTLEEAVKKQLVKKIEWEKFTSISNKLTKEQNGKTKKWENLYSPVVQKFFTVAPDLADYGVPYFLSYLAFAYRGKELEFEESVVIKKEGEEEPRSSNKTVNWNTLIKKVTSESRFHSSGELPKLGLVEDELTIYSLSKLSREEEEMKVVDIPNKFAYEWFTGKEIRNTESEFYNQFMKLNKAGINRNTLGSRPLFLSPDSAVLSEMLSSGELEGIFMYNGDALYAQQLLDKDDEEEEEGIKVISGFPYLWLLDSVAISAQVSPEKEAQIYKFIEKLSFEKLKELPEKRSVLNEDDAPEDSGWLLKNFMAIWYTPVLKDFSGWIRGEKGSKVEAAPKAPNGEGNSEEKDEFKREQEFLYGKEDIEKCLLKNSQPPSEDNNCSIVFERGLSDTQNLNLALAFERWKSNF